MAESQPPERVAVTHIGAQPSPAASGPFPGYSLLRRSRRFLGRLNIRVTLTIFTGIALIEALAFHQIIWWLSRRGILPLGMVSETAIVTILVAVPIIAYSQDVIRLFRVSQKALRGLTRELADARDTLERQVALRTTELTDANAALAQTVVDLRVAKDQAQHANAAKSHFLANMSHELRTPLNAIIGFSQVIKDESFGPTATDRYREYAKDIHSSGEHLLNIIEDVLDMSKIEADQLELQEDELDIALLINAAVKMVNQSAADMGVTLSVDVPADFPRLLADEVRVKQVLLNLLSNAVKFSNPSGVVTVSSARSANGGLTIRVGDTGIGMSDAEMEIAWERFRQIEGVLSRKHHGTGLGLPLTRALMDLHGGSLNLVSEPAVGTTAIVTFPPARTVRPESSVRRS